MYEDTQTRKSQNVKVHLCGKKKLKWQRRKVTSCWLIYNVEQGVVMALGSKHLENENVLARDAVGSGIILIGNDVLTVSTSLSYVSLSCFYF